METSRKRLHLNLHLIRCSMKCGGQSQCRRWNRGGIRRAERCRLFVFSYGTIVVDNSAIFKNIMDLSCIEWQVNQVSATRCNIIVRVRKVMFEEEAWQILSVTEQYGKKLNSQVNAVRVSKVVIEIFV
ncbi:uncharacterized protein LOC110918415 [Helianthus annuus]|uniref:uncharacterized protein LOC110918415 n=1 Tax=Helianthus annuus TaxID=4232 RepID=UPI001653052D|nr:uncharacterized protein LOC110918415 [Helianthus annuus]